MAGGVHSRRTRSVAGLGGGAHAGLGDSDGSRGCDQQGPARRGPFRSTDTADVLTIAMAHVLVPYTVLSVWASLQKLDFMTEQTAGSLGAGSLTVIRRSILPQVIPGVLSGSLIVFALSAGAFSTPATIGGSPPLPPFSCYPCS